MKYIKFIKYSKSQINTNPKLFKVIFNKIPKLFKIPHKYISKNLMFYLNKI